MTTTTLSIWGGAGEHGRSCYLLQHGTSAILLDCGVKKEGPGEYPLLDREIVRKLQTVFLSHAHEDHSIALPLLYKYGYTGEIWTTRETAGQLPGYFAAWSRYAEAKGVALPYGEDDLAAMRFMYLEDHAEPLTWVTLAPGLRVLWGRSGHLAGAVWLALEWNGKKLFFSGDYTEESLLLAVDRPEGIFGQEVADCSGGTGEPGRVAVPADLALVDAAYGTDPDGQAAKLGQLEAALRPTLAGSGSVLLPVPLHGRGQELLLWTSERFPSTRLVVEEALLAPIRSWSVGSAWLRPDAGERLQALLRHPNLDVVSTWPEREQAMQKLHGALVFTNDGMMASAKAQWYYSQLAASPGNQVIFTGHLAEGGFAHRLFQEQSSTACPVSLIRYKVHQGLPDIRSMLTTVPSSHTVLVHAAKSGTDHVVNLLHGEGFTELYSLLPGSRITF
ncbi:MBL fold metallo-hydrolase [Paenibacillus albidus]|uniref:INTS11 family MBL fold metallo-hydrolase n=1 Tax=Paenibacillus albidus TaxID=2041023 RepID=UPI001BEAC241|nr:MBL fold metallo-hydrolase [Paenibacillus albidus]MBT2293262.1 MBL fold metallo-hydrolase [Paenibacillus albidus]